MQRQDVSYISVSKTNQSFEVLTETLDQHLHCNARWKLRTSAVTDIVNTGIGLSSNMDGYYEFDESGHHGKQVALQHQHIYIHSYISRL